MSRLNLVFVWLRESEHVEKGKVHFQVAGESHHAETSLMHARSQTSLSTLQVSKGILPPTTVPLCCASVYNVCVCVHLSVYTNVWMDNHTQIMLPLTIIHRPNFPGLLKPPPSLQWKLVWEKMKDRSDFHAPRWRLEERRFTTPL